GDSVLLSVRDPAGSIWRHDARVVATSPHALTLSLSDVPAWVTQLRTSQALVLVLQRNRVLYEARVQVRSSGKGDGKSVQLEVDRPATLSPARVRVVWRGAEERVRVEFLERFSERLV